MQEHAVGPWKYQLSEPTGKIHVFSNTCEHHCSVVAIDTTIDILPRTCGRLSSVGFISSSHPCNAPALETFGFHILILVVLCNERRNISWPHGGTMISGSGLFCVDTGCCFGRPALSGVISSAQLRSRAKSSPPVPLSSRAAQGSTIKKQHALCVHGLLLI